MSAQTLSSFDRDDAAIASELHADVRTGFNRRRFLALTAGGVAGGALLSMMPELSAYAAPLAGTGGLLLTVWLGGGNDGLNMLAPVDNGDYRSARGNIALDPTTALRIDGGLAFHPALKWVRSQWDLGRVAALAGVGAARYDLSHFQMADNLLRATPDGQSGTTGWLGRWMDADPTSTALTSVAVGDATPAHMLGSRQRGATLPTSMPWNTVTGMSAWDSTAQRVGAQLRNAASSASPLGPLGDAVARGNVAGLDLNATLIPQYGTLGDDWSANRPFRVAARLFASGVGVRVAHVTVGGFDTHVGQTWGQNDALTRLDNGLAAFFADLDPALADRVAVVVFSEFGRTVRVNGSGGTDHGTASTWMALGSRVRGGLYGAVPSLTDLDPSGYFKPVLDWRDVWATLAETWLRADPAQLLGPGRTNLGFAGDPVGGPALAPPPPPPPVVIPTPDPPPPPMVATLDRWTDVSGSVLGAVAAGAPPLVSGELPATDVPANLGDSFATRIRTLVTVPTTGDWTFWLACDDNGVLHLSADGSKASTRLIALVDSWTGERAWDASPTQCSGPIALTAGRPYYLEAYAKENAGGDHLSIAVSGPGVRRQVIPSDWCSRPGDVGAGGWNPVPGLSPIQVDRWQSSTAVWSLTSIAAGAKSTGALRAPRMVSLQERIPNLGSRHRGWLSVPVSGDYVIAASAPSAVRVNLAAGENRSDGLKTIADAAGWSSPHQYDARPGQVSAPVALLAGRRYYVEVWAAHGNTSEHLTVAIARSGEVLAPVPVGWMADCGAIGASGWDPTGSTSIPQVAPGVARNVSATTSRSAIAVKFEPPASAGTSPVQGYVVRAVSSTGLVMQSTVTTSPVKLSGKVTANSRWSVTVAAFSAAGTGPTSPPVTVTFGSRL